MKRLEYFVTLITIILCLAVGFNAEAEQEGFDILATYGAEPTVTITLAVDEYDLSKSIPREEIENALGLPFYSNKDRIVYIADIEGLRTVLSFIFEENELFSVGITPAPTEGGATFENYIQNSVNACHQYYKLFTRELGEPVTTNEVWYDGTYQDVLKMHDYAFEHGHYAYESIMWENNKVALFNTTRFGFELIEYIAIPVHDESA